MEDQPIQTYSAPTGVRIAVSTVAILGLGLGLFILGFPFFGEMVHKPIQLRFLLLAFGLALPGACFYLLLSLFKSRFEIWPNKIRQVGVWREKEMRFEDIQGFRVMRTRNANDVVFVPKEPGIQITFSGLSGQKEIKEWAGKKFKNLDLEDKDTQMRAVLQDDRLGSNEAERKEALRKARIFSTAMTAAGLAAGLGNIFLPAPSVPLEWLLITFPFLGLIGLVWFKGALKIFQGRNSVYPSADFAFVFPVAALGIGGLTDWHFVSWDHFPLPAVFFGGLLGAGLLLTAASDIRERWSAGLGLLIICGIYGGAAAATLNALMDTSEPVSYQTTLTNKWISHGRSSSYHITLAPWGPVDQPKSLTVPYDFYNRFLAGDKVWVSLRAGAFHIPWYLVN